MLSNKLIEPDIFGKEAISRSSVAAAVGANNITDTYSIAEILVDVFNFDHKVTMTLCSELTVFVVRTQQQLQQLPLKQQQTLRTRLLLLFQYCQLCSLG